MTALVIDRRYLAPSEAARRVGVSEARIRQLADAGRLAGLRTPLGRLLLAEAVEAFARERAARRHGVREGRRERAPQ